MENTLEDSSSNFPKMEDPENLELLNNACLLDDSELFDISTHIPETPSPVTVRRKRHYHVAETQRGVTLSSPGTRRSEIRESANLLQTPNAHKASKRRRLEASRSHARESWGGSRNKDFVPASSLLHSDLTWLESPRPSTSSSSSSSTTTTVTSAATTEHIILGAAAGQICSSVTSLRSQTSRGQRLVKEHKTKRSRRSSTVVSPGSPRATSTAPQLVAQEEEIPSQNRERRNGSIVPGLQIQEEIVIVEDDEDDVVVEAMVRSVHMAEDEALARRLQEQFDREEQLQREQRRAQATSPNRHPYDIPHFGSYVGLGWISPWSSMVSSAFSQRDMDLTEALLERETGRRGHRPPSGRTRNSRRRNAHHAHQDLFDDSQGNNYEALLAFEEMQGAASAKNLLSKEEIERFPKISYDPAHNAGKTECRICCSEYQKGEQLRMLPCFHDYHVKCIDYWLKDNTTCPICRADVLELCDASITQNVSVQD